LSFARLVAPVVTITSVIFSSNKIQNGDSLIPAYPDCLEKWPLNKCLAVIVMLMTMRLFRFDWNGMPSKDNVSAKSAVRPLYYNYD